MSWHPFDNGNTLGTKGSEEGVIFRDEEHDRGSRITLEHDTNHAPYTITCGIYGSMCHTAFAGTEQEAVTKYQDMKVWLDQMLADDLSETDYLKHLQEFVDKF